MALEVIASDNAESHGGQLLHVRVVLVLQQRTEPRAAHSHHLCVGELHILLALRGRIEVIHIYIDICVYVYMRVRLEHTIRETYLNRVTLPLSSFHFVVDLLVPLSAKPDLRLYLVFGANVRHTLVVLCL
jgi:hypothetical protein